MKRLAPHDIEYFVFNIIRSASPETWFQLARCGPPRRARVDASCAGIFHAAECQSVLPLKVSAGRNPVSGPQGSPLKPEMYAASELRRPRRGDSAEESRCARFREHAESKCPNARRTGRHDRLCGVQGKVLPDCGMRRAACSVLRNPPDARQIPGHPHR